MSELGKYLDRAKKMWSKYSPLDDPPEVSPPQNDQMLDTAFNWAKARTPPVAHTSEPMTYYSVVCTTGAEFSDIRVESPIQQALEYIKESTKEEWLLHICRCAYCRSRYPANLELGYECPACGAYDFDIEKAVTDTTKERSIAR